MNELFARLASHTSGQFRRADSDDVHQSERRNRKTKRPLRVGTENRSRTLGLHEIHELIRWHVSGEVCPCNCTHRTPRCVCGIPNFFSAGVHENSDRDKLSGGIASMIRRATSGSM